MMRILAYFFAIFVILATTTGPTMAAPPGVKPSAARILERLKNSPLPLTKGTEDCSALAEHYPTLGALVSAREKLANRERTASCERSLSTAGVLTCAAQFSNRVPPSRSEEEFTLRLEFEMKDSKILAVKYFLAG